MKVALTDCAAKKLKDIEISDNIFGVEDNDHVLYLAAKAYRANRRQGTHSTKTRSFVSGGGRKPFRQKGTGNARQGTIRAPHMKGGATVFGPQPRSYRQKLNRKVKKLALKLALTDRVKEKQIFFIDDYGIKDYGIKQINQIIGVFDAKKPLFLDERKDDLLHRSGRNVHGLTVMRGSEVNAENILNHQSIFVSENALMVLTQRLENSIGSKKAGKGK